MADDEIERLLREVDEDGTEREQRLADKIRALLVALTKTVSPNGEPEPNGNGG